MFVAVASRFTDQVLYLEACNSRNKKYTHIAAAVARAMKGCRPLCPLLICQTCLPRYRP